MKEYYRNCDPNEVDSRGRRTCERRVLHLVTAALHFDTLKDAIALTFHDHPIIPKLIENEETSLDGILRETGISLEDKEMKALKDLKEISKKYRSSFRDKRDEMDDLISWVAGYCGRFF